MHWKTFLPLVNGNNGNKSFVVDDAVVVVDTIVFVVRLDVLGVVNVVVDFGVVDVLGFEEIVVMVVVFRVVFGLFEVVDFGVASVLVFEKVVVMFVTSMLVSCTNNP